MATPSNAPFTPKHIRMSFEFRGIFIANEFKETLRKLGHKADIVLVRNGNAWSVQTDTRCLEHAAELLPFLRLKERS